MTDLGTLGGEYGSANGINATGQVVGWSYTTDHEGHAFITGPNGAGMTDLGTLEGQSQALGINDAGQVVGAGYSFARGGSYAFVTGPDGAGLTDLNSLVSLPDGSSITQANAINNLGQIVVVPEPETYALMLAGLGLIGFIARGKKAANSKSSYSSV